MKDDDELFRIPRFWDTKLFWDISAWFSWVLILLRVTVITGSIDSMGASQAIFINVTALIAGLMSGIFLMRCINSAQKNKSNSLWIVACFSYIGAIIYYYKFIRVGLKNIEMI